ncbi:MAG: TRAP transporter large permease subunit [Myxococcota bacterium]
MKASTGSQTGAGKLIPLAVLVSAIVLLPLLGKGGLLAAIILACAILGTPLFVIIGLATILCFVLWAGYTELSQLTNLIERIRTLADNQTLLAIPLFIMSGAIMSKGQISARLIDFARALVGWIPGGLAMSAVIACMLFAAISGSSPATVVAIGAMMGPSLLASGYNERFSHGLLTSAGSLGILIPPSIPMIVYPIVNQKAIIEVEHLFAAGFGPGLIIGGILIGFSFYRGLVDKAPRDTFSVGQLGRSLRDGFWALMFPILILGGIYSGIFNAVEAAAISVVYAVVVETYLHRAMTLKNVPGIFFETAVFLGSLLVIMVAALALSEFLEIQKIPDDMVAWIEGMQLEPWQFLIALNLLLIGVGMMMDILSAMFVFVPLLYPLAAAMGIDPLHFGIIFIVNLEIGYLTPPVGLNLFVASALWERPIGHVIRSVGPFIALMLIGLTVITWFPAVSVGLGDTIMGVEDDEEQTAEEPGDRGEPKPPGEAREGDDEVQTMDQMMQELEAGEASEDPGADGETDEVQTLEEMMQEVEAD